MNPRPGDQEAERGTWIAVAALRIEVLHAGSAYGILTAMSLGGIARAREWRTWLDWVEGFVAQLRNRGEELGSEAVDSPDWGRWLSVLNELLAEFERSGAEAHADALDVGVERDWAIEQLERLAELSRPIEQRAGEPLGEIEDVDFGAGKALLAAVQDSLVLSLSDDPARRAMRAGPEEIYELLVTARQEGAWDFFAAL
jgi:hypothetical protein